MSDDNSNEWEWLWNRLTSSMPGSMDPGDPDAASIPAAPSYNIGVANMPAPMPADFDPAAGLEQFGLPNGIPQGVTIPINNPAPDPVDFDPFTGMEQIGLSNGVLPNMKLPGQPARPTIPMARPVAGDPTGQVTFQTNSGPRPAPNLPPGRPRAWSPTDEVNAEIKRNPNFHCDATKAYACTDIDPQTGRIFTVHMPSYYGLDRVLQQAIDAHENDHQAQLRGRSGSSQSIYNYWHAPANAASIEQNPTQAEAKTLEDYIRDHVNSPQPYPPGIVHRLYGLWGDIDNYQAQQRRK